MKTKKTPSPSRPGIEQICFGLDRSTDEVSLKAFLETFSNPALLQTLIPRMENTEIDETVNYLTGLMKKHLSEKEYHRLFINWSSR